jgi:hypothetical protein
VLSKVNSEPNLADLYISDQLVYDPLVRERIRLPLVNFPRWFLPEIVDPILKFSMSKCFIRRIEIRLIVRPLIDNARASCAADQPNRIRASFTRPIKSLKKEISKCPINCVPKF